VPRALDIVRPGRRGWFGAIVAASIVRFDARFCFHDHVRYLREKRAQVTDESENTNILIPQDCERLTLDLVPDSDP